MTKYAFLLPLLSSILCGVGILVCLAIGIVHGHLSRPPWPFVSETGGTAPESCIFTMLLVMCAFLFFVIAIVYYKYVSQHGHQSRTNKRAVALSGISAIGFCVTGSYQLTQIRLVHWIGAMLAFLGSNVYCWMIVYINIKYMRPILAPTWLVHSRVLLAFIQSLSLIIFTALFVLLMEVGYDKVVLYSVVTSLEWAATYSLLVFIGLFAYDFRQIKDFDYTIKAKNFAHTHTVSEAVPMSGNADDVT